MSRYYIVEMDWSDNTINTTWGDADTIEDAVHTYRKFGGSAKNISILTPVAWREEIKEVNYNPETSSNGDSSESAGTSDVQK